MSRTSAQSCSGENFFEDIFSPLYLRLCTRRGSGSTSGALAVRFWDASMKKLAGMAWFLARTRASKTARSSLKPPGTIKRGATRSRAVRPWPRLCTSSRSHAKASGPTTRGHLRRRSARREIKSIEATACTAGTRGGSRLRQRSRVSHAAATCVQGRQRQRSATPDGRPVGQAARKDSRINERGLMGGGPGGSSDIRTR